jgi:hypothetical protein
MQLTKDTTSYNERRYGKPWIARVNFKQNVKGDFAWGEWCGQAGNSGTLYLECEPGDVVAMGQKDFRHQKYSAANYYIVEQDGSLRPVSKPDACKHDRSRVCVANPGVSGK